MSNRIDQVDTIDSPEPPRAECVTAIPRLTIAFHPDLSRVGELTDLAALQKAGRSPLSRLTPSFSLRGSPVGAPLTDSRVSRSPLWLAAGASGSVVISPENHRTAVRVGTSALAGPRVLDAGELAAGVVIELASTVVLVLRACNGVATGGALAPDDMVGESDAVRGLKRTIAAIAPLPTPVLIRGETGTGKELTARAVHDRSGRSGPFVSINMASLSPTTAASELFGHVAGAFTGAVRPHAGYFEQAHGGTLLLDEVAAAPSEVQAMLLRVLEDGLVRPLGGRVDKRVDVRVIAATDEPLDRAMLAGRFREPLYHRLASNTLAVPPLRDRPEDIGPLLARFLREALAERGATSSSTVAYGAVADRAGLLTSGEMVDLLAYRWPGNVRELRNVAREFVINQGSGRRRLLVTPEVRAQRVFAPDPAGPGAHSEVEAEPRPRVRGGLSPRAKPTAIDEAELSSVLEQNDWRVAEAAARLGVSRGAVYAAIRKSDSLRTASSVSAGELRQALEGAGGDIRSAARALRVSVRALRLRLRALGVS